MVETRHLQAATKVIAEVKERGARLFEGIVRNDSLMYGIERLREALLTAGTDPLTQTQMYNKVRRHFDRETLNLTLSILHELKMVQKFEPATNPKGGPRVTLWRGTTLLAQQGAMELVLEKYNG